MVYLVLTHMQPEVLHAILIIVGSLVGLSYNNYLEVKFVWQISRPLQMVGLNRFLIE